MIALLDVLEGVNLGIQEINDELLIKDIHIDSRKVQKGSVFVAQKGGIVDGHDFINKAIENGASVIVLESNYNIESVDNVVFVEVNSTQHVLPVMLNNFYDYPTSEIKLIGVVGTNGKTTIATMLHDLFLSLNLKSGLLSTVENKIGKDIFKSTHTTPDPVSLFELLGKMRDENCEYVFMEVSSHALDQGRTKGLTFSGGVFTNITHDHLDYHKTFKNYLKAKKIFFDDLKESAFAIVNIDDKNGKIIIQNCDAKTYTYSMQRMADFKVSLLESTINGMHLKIQDVELFSRVIGRFNAYNLLAVYSVAIALGLEKIETIQALSGLNAPDGRFDNYFNHEKKITGIIDYAHTPDAIDNLLKVVADLVPSNSKLITVLGCGGDRDKTKRPIMGAKANALSDVVVLTSDNPRSENPDLIIEEMKIDIEVEDQNMVFSVAKREEAIKFAVALAKAGDIIVIAGKGHENYQEIEGVKYPFEDKKILMKYLN